MRLKGEMVIELTDENTGVVEYKCQYKNVQKFQNKNVQIF